MKSYKKKFSRKSGKARRKKRRGSSKSLRTHKMSRGGVQL